MNILHWIVIAVLLICGASRCLIFNVHNAVYYGVRDVYEYFKYRKWEEFNYYGIDMFIGMFGHGKTLSMRKNQNILRMEKIHPHIITIQKGILRKSTVERLRLILMQTAIQFMSVEYCAQCIKELSY